jgi:ribose transport system substrate-binding protein
MKSSKRWAALGGLRPTLALVAMLLLLAALVAGCGGGGSSSSSSESSGSETAESSGSSGEESSEEGEEESGEESSEESEGGSGQPPTVGAKLGTCELTKCDVYKNVDFSSLEGATVGVMDILPVPGSTRFTEPLRECIKAHGGKTLDVDINGDFSKAPGVFNEWLSQGVSAIAENGIPVEGYKSIIQQAGSKEIPFIGWGTGPIEGVVSMEANQFADGELMAKYVAEQLPEGGEVLSVNNGTNVALRERQEGMKYTFAKYPEIKFVEKTVTELTPVAAEQTTSAYLQANPDVNAVIGGFAELAFGAEQAIKAAGSEAFVVSANGDPAEYETMEKPGSIYKMTVADGHEFGGQLACETIAVMLGGGEAAAPAMFVESTQVTQENIPKGGTDSSPRAIYEVG